LAVAHELKTLDPDVKLTYVGERGSKFSALTEGHTAIDEVRAVSAGKFRRYHGESWLRRLIDLRTNLLNVRDVFRLIYGTIQSWIMLGKIKPDLVFLKGGFVGVPVGVAAAIRHIPIVTHDSDALPGLANRIVSRWATVHAVAMPEENYQYPLEKTEQVGVLVEPNYVLVTKHLQKQYKKDLDIPEASKVLLITGGSSGAARLNQAVIKIIEELLNDLPDLYVIHQVGKGKAGAYRGYEHKRLQILEFLAPMYKYMGAADLVVTRGSANTIAEIGTQGKAAIVVPNHELTGGHQLKNAMILQQLDAAVILFERELNNDDNGLLPTIERLIKDEQARKKLADNLSANTIPDAAHKLAEILIETANNT
jgi:UDP-N-acetylglucosamine--N-acetylmuramyl-(pentapeptide) pyrophosphoryl-undecaprenol N-acetylglucosamine transferase